MKQNPGKCRYCGGSLTATPYQGHPELVDLSCRNSDCKMGWVNQAARCTGPETSQIGFGPMGITRMEQKKPSQGEDNCGPVAEAMLAWLGDGFKLATPCPEMGAKRDSANEEGVDFSIREPCGHTTGVQVTSLPDTNRKRALAVAHREGEAHVDERSQSTLIELIECAIKKKSDRYPSTDRATRILAIDGRCPSVGFNFFLTGVRFTNTREVFGWRGVVLVADKRNMIFFGSEGWPDCAECARTMQHGTTEKGASLG